jgi:hypothetical protein
MKYYLHIYAISTLLFGERIMVVRKILNELGL